MAEKVDFNARTIAEFRAHHGQVGGNFAGAPLLLLHTVGARSGAPRINPMMYLPDQGRYLVFASKAGSDRHPDWYYNHRAGSVTYRSSPSRHPRATRRPSCCTFTAARTPSARQPTP
jgi:hypothetical protein